MGRSTLDIAADLFFQIDWLSGDAVHNECYAGRKVDFRGDLLPERLLEALPHKKSGDRITFDFEPGKLVREESGGPRVLARSQFDGGRVP